MDSEALILSRLQFAFTIAFHILFPSLTIGLGLFLVAMEALWLRTRDAAWFRLYRFWSKIFALSFGMGVVTGIVMEFQFGTNWSRLSQGAGDVLGPLLSYEVLTAFFLEAGFLGVMLFGWNRVRPGVHFLATSMVALGTLFSTFWILSANSWMHTPAGHVIGPEGRISVGDWWQVVFNPSFPYRLSHMVAAALISATFAVAGIAAWQLLRNRHVPYARRGFSLALWTAAVLTPLQVLLGDLHGLNTLEHQPIKIAAMEGVWDTQRHAPLLLFAIPDMQAETNHFEIGIPSAGSLILRHDPAGEIVGLKSVAPEDRPPVPIVFFAFRIMVGIGFLLLAVAAIGLWLRRGERLYETRWFQWLCLIVSPLGFAALLAGWTVTEVGRQPWVIHGLIRTEHALSPNLTGGVVWASFIPFLIVYNALLIAFLYFLYKTVHKGPNYEESVPGVHLPERQGVGGMTAWLPSPGEKQEERP